MPGKSGRPGRREIDNVRGKFEGKIEGKKRDRKGKKETGKGKNEKV